MRELRGVRRPGGDRQAHMAFARVQGYLCDAAVVGACYRECVGPPSKPLKSQIRDLQRALGRAEVPGVPGELARLLAEEKEGGAEDAGACLGARFVRLWPECLSSAVLSSGVRHLSFAYFVVFGVACSANDLAQACRPVAPGAPG